MKKGFTLIELLVVIAIIGILSAVAIVNLNGSRKGAQLANVQASLENLRKAATLCFSNYTTGPTGQLNCTGNTPCPTSGGDTNFWIDPNTDICVGVPSIGKWPAFPKGYTYAWTGGGSDGKHTPNSDAAKGNFRIAMCEADGPQTDYNCKVGGYYVQATATTTRTVSNNPLQ